MGGQSSRAFKRKRLSGASDGRADPDGGAHHTILDIFDALVADDRPYKPGMPVEKALGILDIMAEIGGKLDPELTRLFRKSRCWEKD